MIDASSMVNNPSISQHHSVVDSTDENNTNEATDQAIIDELINSSYQQKNSKHCHQIPKKYWVPIITLILAIIAITGATVSTIILLPKINELSSSTSTDSSDIILEPNEGSAARTCKGKNRHLVWDRKLKKCVSVAPTLSPTQSPTTASPTRNPLEPGQTHSPTSEPTTPQPTTAQPTLEPTNNPTTSQPTPNPTTHTVIIEDYYTNSTITQYYDADCECPTNVYGVLNAGQLYEVGGYYGWEYSSSYPDLYPLADLHISIGDTIKFKARDWTPDDLWLVTEEVYHSCDWSNTTGLRQLANNNEIRGDCATYPWLPCGYEFLAKEWHLQTYGNPLYFASAYRWADTVNTPSCVNGVKVKVYIDNRTAIPVIMDGDDGYDVSATDTIKDLQAAIGHLSRMLILAQFSTEQRVRSEGNSGLTNVRGHFDGDAAYDDGTYTNGAVASIHDHSDNLIVVGIGEIQAVLNGIEFRTRHNDYNLNMPHRNSSEYGAVEPIPYPEVPPSVLSAGSVNDQILEMQEWFRAFKTQNKSHRNYTEYFKPILCYLEGTWILDEDDLEEPFDSDRHQIDAKSWKQLHDKIRWMANSGRKNSQENLAHLPSCIRNLVNDTYPIVSNWEYRIVCHQLANDIPTSRFRIADDLSVQLMGSPETREELYYSRRARFEINKYIDTDNLDDHRWSPGRKRWNYLDYLMEQIPGKDNYIANITDELPDGSEQVIHYETDQALNSGYYSRFYGLIGDDAMGSSKHRRSWSDRYLFAAKTTQLKVSPVEFDFEMEDDDGNTVYHRTISRWSYAIPLEIIYQTPLSRWNPYNIPYIDRDVYEYRTGECTDTTTAYYGYTTNNAYFTPAGFFEGVSETGAGDTHKEGVCALDENGNIVPIYSSGHWITFPEIANGVGIVRQRYPIFPIHNGGSAAFKEVKALQAVVLEDDYDDPVTNSDGYFGDSRDIIYGFDVCLQGGGHQHICQIYAWRIRYHWLIDLESNEWKQTCEDIIELECEIANGHEHTIRIWRSYDEEQLQWEYHLKECRFGALTPSEPFYSNIDNVTCTTQCDDGHYIINRC